MVVSNVHGMKPQVVGTVSSYQHICVLVGGTSVVRNMHLPSLHISPTSA